MALFLDTEGRPCDCLGRFRRLDELVADAAASLGAERPLEQGEGDSFILVFADSDKAVATALDLRRSSPRSRCPAASRSR